MSLPTAVRMLAVVVGALLVAGGIALVWFAVFAARRGEGVFVPIAGVALLALVGGGALLRWAIARLGDGS